jgi:hypothetical protein
LPDAHPSWLIVDAQTRQVPLQLTERLATAAREPTYTALQQADWGLAIDAVVASESNAAQAPRALN